MAISRAGLPKSSQAITSPSTEPKVAPKEPTKPKSVPDSDSFVAEPSKATGTDAPGTRTAPSIQRTPNLDGPATLSGSDRPNLDGPALLSDTDRPNLDGPAILSDTARANLDGPATLSGSDRPNLDGPAPLRGRRPTTNDQFNNTIRESDQPTPDDLLRDDSLPTSEQINRYIRGSAEPTPDDLLRDDSLPADEQINRYIHGRADVGSMTKEEWDTAAQARREAFDSETITEMSRQAAESGRSPEEAQSVRDFLAGFETPKPLSEYEPAPDASGRMGDAMRRQRTRRQVGEDLLQRAMSSDLPLTPLERSHAINKATSYFDYSPTRETPGDKFDRIDEFIQAGDRLW